MCIYLNYFHVVGIFVFNDNQKFWRREEEVAHFVICSDFDQNPNRIYNKNISSNSRDVSNSREDTVATAGAPGTGRDKGEKGVNNSMTSAEGMPPSEIPPKRGNQQQ